MSNEEALELFRKYAEEYNKQHAGPCPDCGRCPTCGGRKWGVLPSYPVYPSYPSYPYQPWITWTSSGTNVGG
jgi:hypothetical protein